MHCLGDIISSVRFIIITIHIILTNIRQLLTIKIILAILLILICLTSLIQYWMQIPIKVTPQRIINEGISHE